VLRATIETIAEITLGEVLAGSSETVVSGLSIDSREVAPGALFLAMSGEHFDGHDYLLAALDAGARALMVTRTRGDITPAVEAAERLGAAVVRVNDTIAALGAIASWHRNRLTCPVVGITGSTGKTTTKDMLTSVLAQAFRVVATQGNRNNEIGVPLTVLAADPNTEVLVVEMGMRGIGQIAELALIARPTMGLVTNVGMSHIELMHDETYVADAKGELIAALPDEGRAFLNGDDAFSERIAALSRAPVTRYGLAESCDIRAESIELDEESRASFDVAWHGGRYPVTLGVPGRHNAYNAIAAAAVALALGISCEQLALGLADARLSAMRMQVFETAGGVTVINDAYNANPVSMRAAVETLAGMRARGRRIAVLGDMAELGSFTELAHFQLGELVARLGIDVLVTAGPRAARIAEGARAAGMSPPAVRQCASVEEASEVLDDLLESGDITLVKASRVMGLERVVEGIVTPRV
jgi:UDP-N-acetylmuramoyl-tripeptide--D-alanyl-D-alanine ligase